MAALNAGNKNGSRRGYVRDEARVTGGKKNVMKAELIFGVENVSKFVIVYSRVVCVTENKC